MAKFAAKDSNKDITLSPHGTGKIKLGTGAATATVESDGNHNISIRTGNSTTGQITIVDGADGNIEISPDNNGAVVLGSGSQTATVKSDGNHNLSLKTGNSTTGTITIVDGADGNIEISPDNNGAVVVGSGSQDAIVQSDGNHDLILKTGNSDTGNIQITDGADGNIDITPHGTGEVNISKVDIDAGTIDGTDVTVGAGKTLDVSAGTLTTITAQKDEIVDGSTAISRSGNNLTFAGTVATGAGITIPDGSTIGSASDTDAIAIASDGGLTFSGGIDDAGTISAGSLGPSVVVPASVGASLQFLSEVSADNSSPNVKVVFSGTFDVYLLIVSELIPASSAQLHGNFYEGAGASTQITSNYGGRTTSTGRTTGGTEDNEDGGNTNLIRIASKNVSNNSVQNGLNAEIYIYNANTTTSYASCDFRFNYFSNLSYIFNGMGSSVHISAGTTRTGFGIGTQGSTNVSSGTIRLYGIKNS